MPFCKFADGDAMHSFTSIENIFMLEYLPDAPSDFVKVYLYARMVCAHPEICESPEEMAQSLHMDESTVTNALRYWEREGIAEKISDVPPVYNLLSLTQASGARQDPEETPYENRSFNRELQSLMPSLVLDGHELRIASDWMDVMGLKAETVLYMVKLEIDKRSGKLPAARTLFHHLNETALDWANHNVTDLPSAEEYLASSGVYKDTASRVIKQFGQRRAPSLDEIDLAKKWLDEWKLDSEVIIAACSETVKSTSPSFAYLDKILEGKVSGSDSRLREQVKALNLQLGVASRPTPAQEEMLKSFLAMGFEFAAIEQAARYCGENNRRSFEDIARKLDQWKKIGAFTLSDIEEERKVQSHFTEIVGRIFESAKIDRKITASDLSFAKVWTALMPLETVLYAAELAVGTEVPMKYINKLVKDWSAAGITTVEKAQQNAPAKAAPEKKRNFTERAISEEEFETGYYADIMNRERKGE